MNESYYSKSEKCVALVIISKCNDSTDYSEFRSQLEHLNGRPLISYSLELLAESSDIEQIYIVCPPKYETDFSAIAQKYCNRKFAGTITPCGTPLATIEHALKEICRAYPMQNPGVMIYEAWRQTLTPNVLQDNIEVFSQYGNAIAAVDCNMENAPHSSEEKNCDSISEAENCKLIQTPQTYRLQDLQSAYILGKESDLMDSESLYSFINNIRGSKFFHYSKGIKPIFRNPGK